MTTKKQKSEAARLLGGISTPKKAAAVRENGRLGGRPQRRMPRAIMPSLDGNMLSWECPECHRHNQRHISGDGVASLEKGMTNFPCPCAKETCMATSWVSMSEIMAEEAAENQE